MDAAAELARSQLLSNPDLMAQLRDAEPEIAEAAVNDPQRFKQLYAQRGERYARMQEEKRQMEQLLLSDPFDVEAQKKIEEAIRQERVLENMEHAMEFSPESFGRVNMLYVDVEVNGYKVKAFVDSGAQATISQSLSFSRPVVGMRSMSSDTDTYHTYICLLGVIVSPDCAQACK